MRTDSAEAPGSWSVVVPVKGAAAAKSRLDLPDELRRVLAAAMSQDTVAAVRGCAIVARVVIVSADLESWSSLGPDVVVVPDSGEGLNAALRAGVAALEAPGAFGPLALGPTAPNPTALGPIALGAIALLPGDLPALTSRDLAQALQAAGRSPTAVVADREGSGTTLLTATPPARPDPRYGVGSFARHQDSGAVDLTSTAALGLRTDVDVLTDLADAVAVGTGPRTTSVLRAYPGILDQLDRSRRPVER